MKIETILEVLRVYAEENGHDIRWSKDYAEPGYASLEHGVFLGNWNSRTFGQRMYPDPLPSWLTVEDPDATYEVEDRTMPRIAAILEKLGAKVEWDDEWVECEGCYRIVRTSPDSYSWLPSYWAADGCGCYCHECVKEGPEGYLEELEGDPRQANVLDIDLEEHGFRRVDEDFENGFYGGQSDDPEVIAESLSKLGVERFIFQIDGRDQFDTHFSVWVHQEDWAKTISWLDHSQIDSKGSDPAEEMKKQLSRI